MSILIRLLDAYELLIVVWAVLSWIPSSEEWVYSIRSALNTIVEPFITPFRKIIPPIGGIDFSPIVAIAVLRFLERLIVYIL